MLRAQLQQAAQQPNQQRSATSGMISPKDQVMMDCSAETETNRMAAGSSRSKPISIPGRKTNFVDPMMEDEDLRFHGSVPLELTMGRQDGDIESPVFAGSPSSWRDQRLEYLRAIRKESSLNERRSMNLSVKIPDKAQEKRRRRKEIDWKRIRERVQKIRQQKLRQQIVV